MECKALVVVQDGCIQDKCCLNLLEVMNAAGIVLLVRRLEICRVALISLLALGSGEAFDVEEAL